MDIYCYHCDRIFNRDTRINGKTISEYENLYGTYCPYCFKFIEPIKDLDILEQNRLKLEVFRQEVRNLLRRKLLGDRNVN